MADLCAGIGTRYRGRLGGHSDVSIHAVRVICHASELSAPPTAPASGGRCRRGSTSAIFGFYDIDNFFGQTNSIINRFD